MGSWHGFDHPVPQQKTKTGGSVLNSGGGLSFFQKESGHILQFNTTVITTHMTLVDVSLLFNYSKCAGPVTNLHETNGTSVFFFFEGKMERLL